MASTLLLLGGRHEIWSWAYIYLPFSDGGFLINSIKPPVECLGNENDLFIEPGLNVTEKTPSSISKSSGSGCLIHSSAVPFLSKSSTEKSSTDETTVAVGNIDFETASACCFLDKFTYPVSKW